MMPLPVWLPGPVFIQGDLCPGGLYPGGLYPGGLYPRDLCHWVSLSRGYHFPQII